MATRDLPNVPVPELDSVEIANIKSGLTLLLASLRRKVNAETDPEMKSMFVSRVARVQATLDRVTALES